MTRRFPVLPLITVAAVGAALWMALLYAPTEVVQRNVQRVFYVHVPAAWIAYLAFIVVALASVLVLVRGDTRWDHIAVSSAEVGVLFTTIVLVTGPIWGRRAWGVWWVWDARLTSTLVLWAIYVAYLLFRSLSPPGERRARLAAVVGIVGALNIPVVHFSVTWWRTQHPDPTVLRPGGPELPGEMLVTLLVALAAFTLVFAALLAVRVRLERLDARLLRLSEVR